VSKGDPHVTATKDFSVGKGNKVKIAGLGAAALGGVAKKAPATPLNAILGVAGGATGTPLNAIGALAGGIFGGEAKAEADGTATGAAEVMQSAVAPEVAQSSTVEATNAVNAASVMDAMKAMNAGTAAQPEGMISPVAVALSASASGYGSGHRATPYGGGMGAGLGALLGAGFGH